MPQDAEVGMAAHDNESHEIAGWVLSVSEYEQSDFEDLNLSKIDREALLSNGKRWVTLGG